LLRNTDRGGPDRPCPDHQNETITAAAELGIDLPSNYSDALTRADSPLTCGNV